MENVKTLNALEARGNREKLSLKQTIHGGYNAIKTKTIRNLADIQLDNEDPIAALRGSD